MKDYTFNERKRKTFILNYKIVDDNIVINLADKEQYIVPYTEENETKVLSQMKAQVEEYSLSASRLLSDKITIPLVFALVVVAVMISTNVFAFGTIAGWLSIGLGLLLSKWSISAMKGMLKVMDDINKSNFTLENADDLNANIHKENALTNVSEKTLRQIEETPEGRAVFDINTVDSMPLEDLKTIKANIDRIRIFGLEEREVPRQGKRRVLIPNNQKSQ